MDLDCREDPEGVVKEVLDQGDPVVEVLVFAVGGLMDRQVHDLDSWGHRDPVGLLGLKVLVFDLVEGRLCLVDLFLFVKVPSVDV